MLLSMLLLFTVGRQEAYATPQSVILGGQAVGMTLQSDGLIVVGQTDVITEKGLRRPLAEEDVQAGDLLISVNGVKIQTTADLQSALNGEKKGETAEIVLKRGECAIVLSATPALDVATGLYRLGLWVRDSVSGVGTLTFFDPETNRFAALGHGVSDSVTKKILSIRGGVLQECSVIGVNRAVKGKPGDLKGIFFHGAKKLASVCENTPFGIFGTLTETVENPLYEKPVAIAAKEEVKPGKATILSTVEGTKPKEYEIEIVKVFQQSKKEQKGMVIRVTDKSLLEKTGGIVQGMSGSPIIQNGKLVGAVTHVLINDPTTGYGIFIENMLNAAQMPEVRAS